MEDYTRSKSYAYGGSNSMQLQPYYRTGVDLMLRCYSASYAQARTDVRGGNNGREGDSEGSKYGKSTSGSRSKEAGEGDSWPDPEFQRKERVASYKMYAEGKVKGSFRKSFRWLKGRCESGLGDPEVENRGT